MGLIGSFFRGFFKVPWAIARIIPLLIITMVVHEYGHLTAFQKRNIPVQEFSIGVGPLLCAHQGKEFTISLRALPFGAYVAAEGVVEKVSSTWDKFVIYFAGIRNNFVIGFFGVFCCQFIGWRRGDLSGKGFVKAFMFAHLTISLRFVSFLITCLSFGFFKLRIPWISLGKITPPRFIEGLILFNLVIGLLNLVPIPPMDGARIAELFLPPALSNTLETRSNILFWYVVVIANFFVDWQLFKSSEKKGKHKSDPC